MSDWNDRDRGPSWRWFGWPAPPPPRPRAALVWWRPPWRVVLRHMTWGWALAFPVLLAAAFMVLAYVGGRGFAVFWFLGAKILLLTMAVPVVFWEHLRQQAYRSRQDPYCVHCGWTLQGMPEEGRCAECGRPFRMSVVRMFQQDPQWVIAYWRLSGRPPTTRLFDAEHPREHVER